jgi:hypothetical protein
VNFRALTGLLSDNTIPLKKHTTICRVFCHLSLLGVSLHVSPVATKRKFVRQNYQGRVATTLLILAMTADVTLAWPHRQGIKARAHFLATSTFIRGSWGGNEDIYLAELHLPNQNDAVLVRLIDTYPNFLPPLAHNALTSAPGVVLSVQRDVECDQPFGEILLRTAPSDPMAILPERLGYLPRLSRMPTPEAVVPCCRILRQ